MLTSLSDVDIREDGCHSIYMYISKYQSYFPEYEFDIFVKKKSDVSGFFLLSVIVHLFKSRLLFYKPPPYFSSIQSISVSP